MFWKRRGPLGRLFILGTLAILLLCACGAVIDLLDGGDANATPAPKAQAISVAAETPTVAPATEPPPTATPEPPVAPSDTPLPTATAVPPTATPVPTETATPPPTATWTPTVAPSESPTPVPTATLSPFAGMTEARVVEVVDGDTIRVSIDGQVYSLRYIGIDTPETVHPSRPVEAMGPEASAANAALVDGQVVYLEKDVSETDRYGRLLRYVWLADGRMVNEELCRQGYAQSSSYPPDIKHQERLAAAAREAREAGRGLWSATAEAVATPESRSASIPLDTAPQPPPAASGSPVQITEHRGGSTPEYIAITNTGSDPVALTGWQLHSVRGDQWFAFPAGHVLAAGATVRVYSATGSAPADGLLWTEKNMWNNEGDEARLIDASGTVVSNAR